MLYIRANNNTPARRATNNTCNVATYPQPSDGYSEKWLCNATSEAKQLFYEEREVVRSALISSSVRRPATVWRGDAERRAHLGWIAAQPSAPPLFAEQCRLDVRTPPAAGKAREGKRANCSAVSGRERDRPRAEAPRDACALAHAAEADTRRARRGVTFSESTDEGGNTASVTEIQCQKVGDPTQAQPETSLKA